MAGPNHTTHQKLLLHTVIFYCLLTCVFSFTYFNFPSEEDPHVATWLQWPHQYTYGVEYRDQLDPIWVGMTKALVASETVKIIAYDQEEKTRIQGLLGEISNVTYYIWKTDDVWVRDNGPIYVKNNHGDIFIEDWGFNGWGGKHNFINCNVIPFEVSQATNVRMVNLNPLIVNEGGSVEYDGNGMFMATRSAILNKNRNPNLTQSQAETLFSQYYGAQKFIWLNGVAGLDITDMHIDGFARFASPNTIVTMSEADLEYWQVPEADVATLYAATNLTGGAYTFVQLPLSQNNVTTSNGTVVGRGSYVNYYVGNTVVVVPNYDDPNDSVANGIIQTLYPNRTITGVDVSNLFQHGGMVHCVTQQQPA